MKEKYIIQIKDPLTEIPTDKDIFSIISAPNVSANFFLFKILENAIKEVESSAMVMISLPEFRLLRGEDQLEWKLLLREFNHNYNAFWKDWVKRTIALSSIEFFRTFVYFTDITKPFSTKNLIDSIAKMISASK